MTTMNCVNEFEELRPKIVEILTINGIPSTANCMENSYPVFVTKMDFHILCIVLWIDTIEIREDIIELFKDGLRINEIDLFPILQATSKIDGRYQLYLTSFENYFELHTDRVFGHHHSYFIPVENHIFLNIRWVKAGLRSGELEEI
jgi:hypothetical protein